MKTLASLDGGAILLQEQGGVFTLSVNEKASIGGGKASGIVSVQGQGSVVLNGKQLFDLLAAAAEGVVPAAIKPAIEGAIALADAEIAAN